MAPTNAALKLIVALDYPRLAPALDLVDHAGDAVRWYKIGLELFSAAGPDALRRVRDRGKRLFFDSKFHDIPNTVAGAARAVGALGVDIFNVHTLGGREMMRAAKAAAEEGAAHAGLTPPAVYGVTILTSLNDDMVRNEIGLGAGVDDSVKRLATAAQEAGLDGVVASPKDIIALRAQCGPDFGILTPGIRPAGSATHDQQRIATPAEAVRDGATYLVVGRPITQADDPVAAARAILAEMETAQ